MPLIKPVPPPPPPLPPDQAFAAEMVRRLADLRTKLVQEFNGLMSYAWNNPPAMGDALTPEDRFAAMRSNAVDLFVVAGALKDAIVYADPSAADSLLGIPAPYAHESGVVYNADGTVTLNRRT